MAYEVARANAKRPGSVKRQWFLNPMPFPDKKSERARVKTVSKHRLNLMKGVWAARVQVAGSRPSSQGKGRGRGKKAEGAGAEKRKDAKGKKFEIERRTVEPEDTNGGERA